MTDSVAINDKFALGMRMGPVFQTTITPLSGGYEDRNQDWPVALWKYEVSLNNRPIAEIRAFMAHVLGRRGAANSFPLRDPLDNTLTDENIGTGNGVTLEFQIKKTYADADRPYRRPIAIVSNLVVKVAGVTQVEDVDYVQEDGWIGFTSAPTSGQAITVTCDWLVAVRFEADQNPLTLPIGPGTSNAFASAGPFVLLERPVPKPDLGTPPPPPTPSTIASVATASALVAGGSPSFAGMSFGAEADDRVLIAFICYDGTVSGAGFPSTITIGGVTANKRVQHLATGGKNIAGYAAAVPTGTSGTVSLTLTNPGASNIGYLCSLLRATAIATTISDTATPAVVSATSVSASINCPAGGVIAAAVFDEVNASAQTWTNLTELNDFGAFFVELSAAGDVFASAQTGRTITVGPGATHTLRLVAASFAHSP